MTEESCICQMTYPTRGLGSPLAHGTTLIDAECPLHGSSEALYDRLLRGEVSSRAYVRALRREARERLWAGRPW